MPTPETPVRECNTGVIFRRSSVFGIIRATAGKAPNCFQVHIGDYVHVKTKGVGRVTALYVSGVVKRLCASVRLLMTASELEQHYNIVGPLLAGGKPVPDYVVFETEEEAHHIKLSKIRSSCKLAEPGDPWPQELYLGGYYYREEGIRLPWVRPMRSREQPQYGKPGSGPANDLDLLVACLGLIVWADDFQTFTRRMHSTTSLCVTYNVLPYPVRQSPRMIRLLSCFPPGTDDMAVFRIIFWCLLQLEKGVVMPAKVNKGSAFVKVCSVTIPSPHKRLLLFDSV